MTNITAYEEQDRRRAINNRSGPGVKIDDALIAEIRRQWTLEGRSRTVIATSLGISETTVKRYVNGYAFGGKNQKLSAREIGELLNGWR